MFASKAGPSPSPFRERFRGDRTTGPLLGERSLLLAITIFWVVIGAVSWVFEYGLSFVDPQGPMSLGRAARRWVYAGLWWVATLLGIWLADTFTVRAWQQYPWMIFHAVCGAVISLLWAASAYYINVAIVPGWRPEGVGRMLSSTSLMTWFFYTGIVCLAHAVIYAREYRTRELHALQAAHLSTEAQLQGLKMQLQPHFLFNALHSISTLMHRDVKAANEMLVLVAEMLQRGLERARTQEVTLGEEIRTAELFLEIELVRFRDRLSVVWNVEPDVMEALVPHMLLQPIVDNSLRHGIEARSGPGCIEISAHRKGERLNMEVRDDGRGLTEVSTATGFGIGLSVTRERLSKLYGEDHSFILTEAPGRGAVVRVSIPYVRGRERHPQEATDVQTDPSTDRR